MWKTIFKIKSDIRHQWVDMDDISGKRNNDIKFVVLSFRKIFNLFIFIYLIN